MTLFLKRLGFILIVFFLLVQLLSFTSLWALRRGSFYKPSFLINSVDEQNFDYIILGASTGLTTLNTEVVDSLLGTKGINLSMDDTAISSQFVMLKHFINQGNFTRYCILASSIKDFDVKQPKLSGNDYRFLPFINEQYISDYYAAFDSFDAVIMSQANWLPIASLGYYNMELFYPAIISVMDSKKRNRFDANGNYSYPTLKKPSVYIADRRKMNLNFSNPYLKKIKEYCDTNNIKLICYISPHEKIEVNSLNTSYDIINHSLLLTDKRFFYDAMHINSEGRQLVSERFANELGFYLK